MVTDKREENPLKLDRVLPHKRMPTTVDLIIFKQWKRTALGIGMAHHQLIFIQIWASEINVAVGNIKAVDGTTQNLVTVLCAIVHSAAYD